MNDVQKAFEALIADGRARLLILENDVKAYKEHTLFTESSTEKVNPGEAIANIMLAYRHIEDARMRLGKVYQALNGGVSNNER